VISTQKGLAVFEMIVRRNSPTRVGALGRSLLLLLLLIPVLAPGSQAVFGTNAMVVAQEPLAADVGLDILKHGGNAVDAALAVGFALSVTHPFAGNIGGGGFMLVRMADGRTSFIDFRETAPRLATPDLYMRPNCPADASLDGWLSVAVPGTVRGLEMANTNFGTRKWSELLQPAIRLASDGFPVSRWQMKDFRSNADRLSQSNSPDSARIFLKGGSFYQLGETFRQPELTKTLERIARYEHENSMKGRQRKCWSMPCGRITV
jgi:gamma-glutamyltranspeptidase/glutathione hydrolase